MSDLADAAAEVTALSDRYEAALVRNDVATLDALFADDERVLRFGLADMQRGKAELVAWRASAPAVNRGRQIVSRDVTALAADVVAVDLTFVDGPGATGRQSQTWLRGSDGWRIVRAHVSIIPD
jgi:hypothetical protein